MPLCTFGLLPALLLFLEVLCVCDFILEFKPEQSQTSTSVPQLWCQEQPNNTKAEVGEESVRSATSSKQKQDQCSRWFDSLQLCPLKKITFRKFHKEQKKRNVCPTGGGPLCILDTHMWVIRIWQAGSLLITATLMKTVKNFMITCQIILFNPRATRVCQSNDHIMCQLFLME